MGSERVTRRLAAIVAADVAGYSRLIAADEEGTYLALRRHRTDLIDPKIKEFGGRIANTAGDSLLIEFPSVVDALRCSLDIQAAMHDRNQEVPQAQRIEYRIGVNLGDVIEADGDLLGDGVNVAARLENLAEPGGVCLSRAARDQVRDRFDISLEDLGEVEVKNFVRPIRVFRVRRDQLHAQGPELLFARLETAPGSIRHEPTAPKPPPASAKQPTDELSILVLPFGNPYGGTDQDYFCDAIVEDIITDLTRLEGCHVIAHGTSSTFKKTSSTPREIGLELGVMYVVGGTVLRVDNNIRANVQLIESDTGRILWADSFHGCVENMLLLSDQVTLRISRALRINLVNAAARRPLRAEDPTAVDLTLRGRAILNGRITRENYAEARSLFSKALDIAPSFVDANALLGVVDVLDYGNFCTPPSEHELLMSAERHLNKALDLEPHHPWARYGLAFLYTIKRQPEAAREEALVAISLDRTLTPAYIRLGQIENFLGQADEALFWTNKALQISPREPRAGSAYFAAALSNALLGNDEEVIRLARKSLAAGFKTHLPFTYLASSLAHLNRLPEAQEVLRQMHVIYPNVSIESLYSNRRSDNPIYLAKWQRYFAGLRLAGLRER